MKPKTFIDLASNDPFGKNVPVVKHPINIYFKSDLYAKNVKNIQSFINENNIRFYMIVIKRYKYYYQIISKLIEIIKHNERKTFIMFLEYVIFNTFISHLPKIWYNGSEYMELYDNNTIYGYIRIQYVNYNFIIKKDYLKYNPLLI